MIFKRRIPERNIQHIGFLHNAFRMGKGVIASFAMILAHAALPHTSEAQIGVSQMYNRIIDASTAKGRFSDGLGFMHLTSGEQIQSQRLGVLINRR